MNKDVNFTQYIDRMTKSTGETSKGLIPEYVRPGLVLDFGSGSGVLTAQVAQRYPSSFVYGYDANPKMVEVASATYPDKKNFNFVSELPDIKYDTIIFSSVLHEVFSYPTEEDSIAFSYKRLHATLEWAYAHLQPGGKLIIRDGVMNSDSRKSVRIKFKTPEALDLAKRFFNDYKGSAQCAHDYTEIDASTIETNPEMAMQCLYTITWGAASYPREVREQYGYFTEDVYKIVLESKGFNILNCSSFTELGYYYHLGRVIEYMDENNQPIDLPKSTIFIVAEK